MKKFIYKITNNINGKVYIGQTNNPKRRFQEHKNKGYGEAKILYYAFDKYGIENFSFETIEEVKNYNEREKYWIKYYDSFENGYNLTEGGENPPIKYGENHHLCSHSQEVVDLIYDLLKNTKMTVKEIAKSTGYNSSSINRINKGEIWKKENYNYPIRSEITKINRQQRAKNIINDLLNSTLTQKQIAEKYGVGRTTITAINNGQNFKQSNLSYPLRKEPVSTIPGETGSRTIIDT